MDFFQQTTVVCEHCNRKAEKKIVIKNGFRMRGWQCPVCKKIWLHPLDEQHFKDFQRLRQKSFQVKLRMVGNSWTISIPKEIIAFEDIEKEMDRIIRLSLEEPNKLSIMFKNEIAKLIKDKEE